MAQGEGISLLLRAYVKLEKRVYLESAEKAMNFMKKDIETGGVTYYEGDKIFLKEYPTLPTVLNGWIFSIFGLYDYCIIKHDDIETKEFLNRTIKTLEEYISKFDLNYWSKYDSEKIIASPFYHELHIQLLMALYDLTEIDVFQKYAEKWEKCEKNIFFKTRAFIKKAYQKIRE